MRRHQLEDRQYGILLASKERWQPENCAPLFGQSQKLACPNRGALRDGGLRARTGVFRQNWQVPKHLLGSELEPNPGLLRFRCGAMCPPSSEIGLGYRIWKLARNKKLLGSPTKDRTGARQRAKIRHV